MNTPWSARTLCTVQNIRDRLGSPETLLVLSLEDDTPIAVSSVNTTTNTLTTGIAQAYKTGMQVQFAGSSLPAPLVAATTYYVVNPTSTTFQVSTVKGGAAIDLTTAGSGTITVALSGLNAQIQKKITRSNQWMYDDLERHFKGIITEVVQTWNQYKAWQVNNAVQRLNRDIRLLQESANLPNIGFVATGTVFDYYYLMSFSMNMHPRTFAMQGTPGVTDYAGIALTGDYCIDTAAELLYINRGTSDTPSWEQPTAELALDNLLNAGEGRIRTLSVVSGGTGYAVGDTGTITGGDSTGEYRVSAVSSGVVTAVDVLSVGNLYDTDTTYATATTLGVGTGLTLSVSKLIQNKLRKAAEEYTLWAMAQDGLFRNTPNMETAPFRMDAESLWNKRCHQSLTDAIPLLQIDLDGDGAISNYERLLNTSEPAIMG